MLLKFSSGGSIEKELALDTRAGEHIPNGVSPGPIYGDTLQWQDEYLGKHPHWIERKKPCGVYNCFGLVFANRRTSIYETTFIDEILRQDRFKQIAPQEVELGDLVVYRDERFPVHAGRIVRAAPMYKDVKDSPKNIRVLSKWGPNGGEATHPFDDIPGWMGIILSQTQFWTDRFDHEYSNRF